ILSPVFFQDSNPSHCKISCFLVPEKSTDSNRFFPVKQNKMLCVRINLIKFILKSLFFYKNCFSDSDCFFRQCIVYFNVHFLSPHLLLEFSAFISSFRRLISLSYENPQMTAMHFLSEASCNTTQQFRQ